MLDFKVLSGIKDDMEINEIWIYGTLPLTLQNSDLYNFRYLIDIGSATADELLMDIDH
ncbi:hypothetical protein SAMN05421761_103244 [Belliella pelovolcani]|uniref:Uncharacterized protein n=1 Tax=Belliella pelovolcani TaxID=529505 RepID=A0A1N7LDC5_9BACT|nr:hypothetical protein SAMN05421761_103244 [Belliella pelovolcani]